jgi:hypothetical protein
VLDARQLGVINFALKNGFHAEGQADRKNLEMVYRGDRSKVMIVTVQGVPPDQIIRPGFIFSLDSLHDRSSDLSAADIENMNLTTVRPANMTEYIASSITVRFIKEKKP